MIASRSMFLVLCFLGEMPRHKSCPDRSGPSYGYGGSAARCPLLPAAPGRAHGSRTQVVVTSFFKWAQSNPSY